MKNIMPPINTPDNAFHDGNPATGEQGTIVPGLWLNNSQGATRNIQQELISVLTEVGIEINESENNQLLLAILELIATRSPDLPVASTTQKGIVQLSNATNNTSETLAATPKAVRAVDIAALKIANNLSEIKDAGLAAVAQTLANLGLGDVAHLPQLTGVVGMSRNARMSVTAASSTATFTADELIVQTTLGGLQYKLTNFNKTINLATTGAGGMDAGAAPATGFVALYAIYNPTTQVSALLAVNTTSVFAPEICGGVIPLGYTASALVGVLPIRFSKFRPSYLAGRTVSFELTPVYISSSVSSPVTRLDISTAVPKNATLAKGVCSAGGASSLGGYSSVRIWSNLALVGEQEVRLGGQAGSGADIVGNFAVNVIEQQSLYFSFSSDMTGAISGLIKISSYEF